MTVPARRKPEKIEAGKYYRLQWLGMPHDRVYVAAVERVGKNHCRVDVHFLDRKGVGHLSYSYSEFMREVWSEISLVKH